MYLTREQILESSDLKTETIPVPEWVKDGEVLIKVITARHREKWEAVSKMGGNSECHIRALLISMSCCDEHGNTLFTPDDVEALKDKSVLAFDRVYNGIVRLNTLTASDIEIEKKDSEKTP